MIKISYLNFYENFPIVFGESWDKQGIFLQNYRIAKRISLDIFIGCDKKGYACFRKILWKRKGIKLKLLLKKYFLPIVVPKVERSSFFGFFLGGVTCACRREG